ncbi:neprilysin-1-like [Centruroides sculpturatus]|uniref:neprilysin-1-like n=1 Tax=Centruroides sculpturatus TaxID=218467 RepID=UPI000C6DBD0A|nr:neprilysin-1-like [Centruroides sculpturatus]
MIARRNQTSDIESVRTKAEYPEKRSSREKKLCVAVVVLLILVLALLIAVIILAILDTRPEMEEICTEPYCVKSANFILSSMNNSVDPCEDFYQFSCGKWIEDHSEDHGTRTLSVASEKLEKILKEIFKLEKQNEDSPNSVKKIIKAFDACTEHDDFNTENKEWIKKVTNEAGGFPLIDTNFRSSFSRWTELYSKLIKTYIINSPLQIFILINPLNTSENVIHMSQPTLNDKTEITRNTLTKLTYTFGNTNNASIQKDIDDVFWLIKTIANLSRSDAEVMEDKSDHQLVTIEELNSIFSEVDWLPFIRDIFKDFLKPGVTITAQDYVFLNGKKYIKSIIDLFEKNYISER